MIEFHVLGFFIEALDDWTVVGSEDPAGVIFEELRDVVVDYHWSHLKVPHDCYDVSTGAGGVDEMLEHLVALFTFAFEVVFDSEGVCGLEIWDIGMDGWNCVVWEDSNGFGLILEVRGRGNQ